MPKATRRRSSSSTYSAAPYTGRRASPPPVIQNQNISSARPKRLHSPPSARTINNTIPVKWYWSTEKSKPHFVYFVPAGPNNPATDVTVHWKDKARDFEISERASKYRSRYWDNKQHLFDIDPDDRKYMVDVMRWAVADMKGRRTGREVHLAICDALAHADTKCISSGDHGAAIKKIKDAFPLEATISSDAQPSPGRFVYYIKQPELQDQPDRYRSIVNNKVAIHKTGGKAEVSTEHKKDLPKDRKPYFKIYAGEIVLMDKMISEMKEIMRTKAKDWKAGDKSLHRAILDKLIEVNIVNQNQGKLAKRFLQERDKKLAQAAEGSTLSKSKSDTIKDWMTIWFSSSRKTHVVRAEHGGLLGKVMRAQGV